MKRPISIILFVIACIAAQSVTAQQIYLSPEGLDGNPGTRDQPMATLTGARDKVRQYRKNFDVNKPVEIIALEGEYFMRQPLVLTPEDNGTSSSPLVIRSENGKTATFHGGMEVSGFEPAGDNLWRVFIPSVAYNNFYFEQLYVNGKRATRARTPDKGFFHVKAVSETVVEKGKGRYPEVAIQKILLDSSDARCFEDFTEQDFSDGLVTFYHNWDNTRKRVMYFNEDESAIYTTGEGMKPWNPINSKSSWFADNFKGALNAPGEWFLERSGYLYYIPEEGQTIKNTSFIVPIIQDFLIITGTPGRSASNFRFENISFGVSGYNTPPSGNEPAQAAAPVGAAITLDFASDVTFRGCEVAHTGTYAFWFRKACSNCTVQQTYMHDLGAGGVKIGELTISENTDEITRNITIDNNIIRDAGHVFPCAVGIILFNASDNKLTHNEIADLRYSGISAGWVWGYAPSPSKRNTIEFNHIHHLGWGELSDMGGVYTLGASEGTTVSNNVIHHIYSFDYGGWGLYTDEGSYGITEENNLVYACKNSGFHQHYGKENVIRNNIFAFNIRSQLQATRIEEHRSLTFTNNIIYFDRGTLTSSNWHKINMISDYNCYFDTRTKDVSFAGQTFREWQKSGKDTHSVIADPMFVNPQKFDFRFKSISVAEKINFKPFDYSKAGVYGSAEWMKLAAFNPEIAAKFDGVVERMEAADAAKQQ